MDPKTNFYTCFALATEPQSYPGSHWSGAVQGWDQLNPVERYYLVHRGAEWTTKRAAPLSTSAYGLFYRLATLFWTVLTEIMCRVQRSRHLQLEVGLSLARNRWLNVSVYDLSSSFFLVQNSLCFLCDFVVWRR